MFSTTVSNFVATFSRLSVLFTVVQGDPKNFYLRSDNNGDEVDQENNLESHGGTLTKGHRKGSYTRKYQ